MPRPLIVYGGSAMALVVAVALRELLTPLIGDTLPLVTPFGAVAFAVWLGGYRPALLVVVVGYLACAYLFIRPRSDPSSVANLVDLVAYLFTCTIIILFGEIMRRAQRASEVRREFLRVTTSSVGDAVITTDTKGLVTSLNPIAQALTGWTDRDARGTPLESIFRIVNWESATVESPVDKVLKTGEVVGSANHTVLVARDGTERTIDDSAAPIRDAEGQIVGCVLVFRDISERRRAEAALREKEERFRLVVEGAKDYAIITLGADGTVTSWNSGATNVLGYDEPEMVGQNVRTVFERDDVELGVPESELQEALAEGRATHERWHVRKDGSRFWASGSTLRLHHNGDAVGFVKIMRDMTATKRAAEELQASERRLAVEAAAMNRLHELVSRLLRCSDLTTAMQEVLDATMSLVGADMGNVQLFDPEDGVLEMVAHRGLKHQLLDHFRGVSREVGTACERALKTRERVLIENVERDPAYAPYLSTVLAAGYRAVQSTPVMGRNGKLLGILSTHYRKPHRPAERDLRMLDLYARQAADFIERMRVDQTLRDADRQKDEFLATLSHELRNPLAPVRNSLEVMKRANGNSGLIEQARSTMERQIAQMVRLIDDLLDVSRITRNRLELRRERVELASIIWHAVEANRPLFDSAHHELEVVLPEQPIHLDADPMRLAQVFGNLLTNAGKYTRPGGHISLVAERQDNVVRVAVRDNGIGIPSETLPKVFDLFTQVDRTLERSGGGLGIGLSLVKRLVEMHDGMVTAHSAGKDRGSEFVVRLPIPPALPKEEHVQEISAHTEPGGRRILVVDDNRDAAVSLAMLLKVTGNDTQTAYDGFEAVEKAAAYKPDVILLDIGLPKLNGYDACRAIREQPWGKSIMMVALTGWGQEEDRRKSSEAGFDSHLVKPVDHAVLVKLLGEATSPM